MRLDQVPETLHLETDGEVWAEIPLTPLVRGMLAWECTKTHQSLEVVVNRMLKRFLRNYEDKIVVIEGQNTDLGVEGQGKATEIPPVGEEQCVFCGEWNLSEDYEDGLRCRKCQELMDE